MYHLIIAIARTWMPQSTASEGSSSISEDSLYDLSFYGVGSNYDDLLEQVEPSYISTTQYRPPFHCDEKYDFPISIKPERKYLHRWSDACLAVGMAKARRSGPIIRVHWYGSG